MWVCILVSLLFSLAAFESYPDFGQVVISEVMKTGVAQGSPNMRKLRCVLAWETHKRKELLAGRR